MSTLSDWCPVTWPNEVEGEERHRCMSRNWHTGLMHRCACNARYELDREPKR